MSRLVAEITAQGIVIESLWITASHARLTVLKAQGIPIPEPRRLRALVDTGATCSCVDKAILQSFGLTPSGFTYVHTASTGKSPLAVNQYDVSFWLAENQIESLMLTIPVIEADFGHQTINCLIGMDVLKNCVLHVDGPARTAELHYNFMPY